MRWTGYGGAAEIDEQTGVEDCCEEPSDRGRIRSKNRTEQPELDDALK